MTKRSVRKKIKFETKPMNIDGTEDEQQTTDQGAGCRNTGDSLRYSIVILVYKTNK